MDEKGYIQFNCEWEESEPLVADEISELNTARQACFERGLIGVNKQGIGYGNISQRTASSNEFIITGTQTGALEQLSGEHYTRVVSFELEQNFLRCKGPVRASSESLTHAAVYVARRELAAVIHVHHLRLWQALLESSKALSVYAEAGSVQIAEEIQKLATSEECLRQRIIVMAGHSEGVLAVGESLAQACEVLFSSFERLC